MSDKAAPPSAPAAERASMATYKTALRKAIRRNAREPEVNFLNITAMLDMMTIILVFLLKGMSSSSASVPQSDDMTLPVSIITGEPSQEGTTVTISKSQILVGDDPNPVVPLPSRASLAQSGVDARFKREGPTGLYIVPLGSALAAARQQDKLIRQAKGLDASTSEAIVIADQTTPYRLLIEVFYTLGEHEFARFHLLVLSGGAKP